jgi:amidase
MSTNKKATRKDGTLSRRKFFGLSAVVGTSLAAGTLGGANSAAAETAGPEGPARPPDMRDDPSIGQLQALMASGKLTSHKLTKEYLDRIRDLDKNGPKLNSVIELNPDALDIAKALDAERKRRGPRGPLHGIPILLKDNIDTGDRMQTTAGSWALYGRPASRDSTTAARLRAAGAVILGKTNLSEFANFRAWIFTSGWSGRGGQTLNPNVLDRNPLGSSAGSAVSVAANLVTVAIGTETDGSITIPAAVNGVVGIKPTLGLTSRAGVVPIAHSQDTVGPFGRTVADAAIVLGALVGVDPRDPATQASAGRFYTNYAQFLNPDGLRGARIGVMRHLYFGNWAAVDALAEAAIQRMRDAGAVIVDPADIPTVDQLSFGPQEFNILLYEFKRDLNAYLATRSGIPARTLADVIAFNETHPEERLNIFDQQLLHISQDDAVSDQVYQDSLALQQLISRSQGIDAIMTQHNLDALMAPTFGPVYKTDWIYGDNFSRNPASPITPAAQAGYPSMSVPLGDVFGLPIGMAFVGRAFSEPTLIRVASGFEAVIGARKPPMFLPSIEGTTAEMLMASRGPSRESAKDAYAREVKKRAGAGRLAP